MAVQNSYLRVHSFTALSQVSPKKPIELIIENEKNINNRTEVKLSALNIQILDLSKIRNIPHTTLIKLVTDMPQLQIIRVDSIFQDFMEHGIFFPDLLRICIKLHTVFIGSQQFSRQQVLVANPGSSVNKEEYPSPYLSEDLEEKKLQKSLQYLDLGKQEEGQKLHQESAFEHKPNSEEEIGVGSKHQKGVWALHYNRHNETLYSGAYDGTICAWTPGGSFKKSLKPHQSSVLSIISDRQGHLLSGSSDHQIRYWSPFSMYNEIFFDRCGVYSLHLLPSSNAIAFGSCQMPRNATQWKHTIKIGSLTANEIQHTISGHEGGIAELKSNDASLFSASADHTVGVSDLATGQMIRRLKNHQDYVYTVETSLDYPHLLLTGSRDKAIKIWDTRNFGITQDIRDSHLSTVYSIKELGGSLFASGSRDMTVKIRDLRREGVIQTLDCNSYVYRLEKVKDSILVAATASLKEMSDTPTSKKSPTDNLIFWQFS